MAEKKGAGGKLQKYDENTGEYGAACSYDGKGKEYRQNTSYEDILRNQTLTKKEFAIWYKRLGEIKRGGYVDCAPNGIMYIPIENKIVITSGSYESPRLKAIVPFSNEEEMLNELNRIRSKINEPRKK